MISYHGIRIEQQYAKLGIQAERSKITIKQPKATFELESTPPRFDIEQPRGRLTIDQSRAWDALGVGSNLRLMSLIYDQSHQFSLEGIARIVENGNRLAAIHLGGNPIADIAGEQAFRDLPVQTVTMATNDNVDITYEPQHPNIELVRGRVDANIRRNLPEIGYIHGKVHYDMLQKQSIKITPPQLDIRV